MNLNLAAMSQTEALTHVIESRLRNILFKTAKNVTGFRDKRQHLVLDAGILSGNFGADLGVVRYGCICRYQYTKASSQDGQTTSLPKTADLELEISFANTGARMNIRASVSLINGTVLDRQRMSSTLEAVSSTTRFGSFSAVVDAIEQMNLLANPTFVLTEGDESKYQDQQN